MRRQLTTTLNRLLRTRVLDWEADPDTVPSRPARRAARRGRAGPRLAVRYVRLGGSGSPADRLVEQVEQVAELTWARQVLDDVSGLRDCGGW
jgi:hypothetical protein